MELEKRTGRKKETLRIWLPAFLGNLRIIASGSSPVRCSCVVIPLNPEYTERYNMQVKKNPCLVIALQIQHRNKRLSIQRSISRIGYPKLLFISIGPELLEQLSPVQMDRVDFGKWSFWDERGDRSKLVKDIIDEMYIDAAET